MNPRVMLRTLPPFVASPTDGCPGRALQGFVGGRRCLEQLMIGTACPISPPMLRRVPPEDGDYRARSRSTS